MTNDDKNTQFENDVSLENTVYENSETAKDNNYSIQSNAELDYFDLPSNQNQFYNGVDIQAVMLENENRYMKRKFQSAVRKPLVLALLGLILSLFYGVGIFFSCIAFFMSRARLVQRNSQFRNSTTTKWAIVLSVIGLILNASMIIVFSSNSNLPF